MITVMMVLHFLIAAMLVGLVLLQKSEKGALGGLSGGSSAGLVSARGSANVLTRATAILAAAFFATSIILALLFKNSGEFKSFMDTEKASTEQVIDDGSVNTQEAADEKALTATPDKKVADNVEEKAADKATSGPGTVATNAEKSLSGKVSAGVSDKDTTDSKTSSEEKKGSGNKNK